MIGGRSGVLPLIEAYFCCVLIEFSPSEWAQMRSGIDLVCGERRDRERCGLRANRKSSIV